MILDSEKERELLEQTVNSLSVSGREAEVIVALKQQIGEADIEEPDGGCPVEQAIESVTDG